MATGIASTTFPGSGSNYVDATDIDLDDDYMIIAWFYSSSATKSKGIICTNISTVGQLHLSSNNSPHVEQQYNDGSNIEVVQTANFTNSKWWFGAAGHDATGKVVSINMGDGSTNCFQDATDTYTGTPSIGTRPQRIGILNTISNWNFGGQISQAIVYTRYLSVSELQEVQWNPASIPDGLSSWIPLWGSTKEKDLSPNQSNGTLTGSLSNSSNGPPIFLLGGQ